MIYERNNEMEFMRELRETILTGNLSKLSMGTMLFHECGVVVTDDIEEEYINPDKNETVVETEHASELSWMLYQIKANMHGTMLDYTRDEFFGMLADAANLAIARTDDRTAILLAVFLELSFLTLNSKQVRMDRIKDEAMACAASLADLAEKM